MIYSPSKQAKQFSRIHQNYNTLILWLSHPTSGNLPYRNTYKHDKPRQYIKKQRHYFANKGLYSQSYGFSSSHVWMWELDHKESWAPRNWCFWTVVLEKNWCFWTVVLEKTFESPLDCKEIQPVHPKEMSPGCLLDDCVCMCVSHSFVSDSLRPHGLQHVRLPCLSPSPEACSNSCPLSWWCHPTISSSVAPFSSCL